MTLPIDSNGIHILAAILVLGLPGAAWLAWAGPRDGWLESLADAAGLSISLYALAGLLGFLAGWQFRAVHLRIAALVCLFLLVAGLLVRHPRAFRPGPGWAGRLAVVVAGLLGVAAAVAWRIYQARGLLLPAWVDSLHHTLIVQLILAHGGIPATLEPVVQAPLGYHYGFHLVTAIFSAVSGMAPAQSVLWFGQALNGLIGLSVYRLGREIWGDWRKALLAGLLVTFALQMPAYYVTWGRYTLSAGLLILPLAMAALVRVLRGPARFADALTLVVLTAGVALTHLTALFFLGLFTAVCLAAGLVTVFSARKSAGGPAHPWRSLWAGALGALAGVVLALPWLLRIYLTYGSRVGVNFVSPVSSDQSAYWQYILYLLGPRFNLVLLILAGVGLLWTLVRSPQGRAAAVWGLVLGLLALPWGLRLGPFRPDLLAIVLFLPASLLLAAFVFDLVDLVGKIPLTGLRLGAQAVLWLAALGTVAWGGWQTHSMSNNETDFVGAADLQALDWIRSDTPPDATFLINTTVWMGTTYRGVDGGYWIPLLTGRETILPPALYTLGTPAYVAQITDQAQSESALTTCDQAFWDLVAETGAGYIYVRQGSGSLQPAALDSCSGVVPVYRRDGVFIYALAGPG